MKLSRSSEHALNVMLQLARAKPDIPISSVRLARAGRMPERYLLQILQRLVEFDVLVSIRGVAGGYLLARSPREITLLEIIDAFDGPSKYEVPTIRGLAPNGRKKLAKTLQGASKAMTAELEKTTLAELARQDKRRAGR